jgi:hypothetical protein
MGKYPIPEIKAKFLSEFGNDPVDFTGSLTLFTYLFTELSHS